MMDLNSDPQSLWPAFLLFHFILAFALWKMAQRVKDESPWFAFVPILNLLLMLRIARKPLWWALLFFVPLVNIIVAVVVTMAVCVRFGVNKWAGLLALVSPLNLVLYYYLAFGTKTVADASPAALARGEAPAKPETPKVDAPPPAPPAA